MSTIGNDSRKFAQAHSEAADYRLQKMKKEYEDFTKLSTNQKLDKIFTMLQK